MPDQTRIVPVILSGGSGTRLWPMSRPENPKQMLALTAEQTMLQLTAMRTGGHDHFGAPIVVANAAHADMVEEQLAAIGAAPRALILEPAGRNTAPAIALAAIAAGRRRGTAAGDAVGSRDRRCRRFPRRDRRRAAAGSRRLAGHVRDRSACAGNRLRLDRDRRCDRAGVNKVARFVEKPPLDKAEAMLAAGDHVWNGGIFLFRADAYLDALGNHAPAILEAAQHAMAEARTDGARIMPDAAAFASSPSDSIDYAVMEKASRVAVVPVSMGWSDVGSWDALHALAERDASGNASTGEVISIDSNNCFVRTDGPRIAMVGVDDLIVVASGNDVLIVPRGRSQDVKKLIEAMKG